MGVPVICGVILASLWILGRTDRRGLWWVVGAFGFSAAGDYFLSTKGSDESRFVAGIALFFVAHIGYLVAAWLNGRVQRLVLGGLLLVFVGYYVIFLGPAIESPVLRIAVLLYLLISCLVLAVAAGLEWRFDAKVLYVTGIASIVFSDTVISFHEFLGFRALNWTILPTYYLAHLLVTASLLRRNRADRPSADG